MFDINTKLDGLTVVASLDQLAYLISGTLACYAACPDTSDAPENIQTYVSGVKDSITAILKASEGIETPEGVDDIPLDKVMEVASDYCVTVDVADVANLFGFCIQTSDAIPVLQPIVVDSLINSVTLLRSITEARLALDGTTDEDRQGALGLLTNLEALKVKYDASKHLEGLASEGTGGYL